jgi:hypothetical protein
MPLDAHQALRGRARCRSMHIKLRGDALDAHQASRGRARCTSSGGRTTRSARATAPPSAARGTRSWTWCRRCGAALTAAALVGARGACGASVVREADEAGGGKRALPPAVPPLALCQGRGHRGSAAAVHSAEQAAAAEGERLDPLGGRASGGDSSCMTSSRFSGISARKGGTSTAMEASKESI